MAVQIVFSDNLDPASANLSSRFTDAVGFYFSAPLISEELEIDCYLQIYFPAVIGEQVRTIPLGRISEGSILLNRTDSETALPIPDEFVDTGLEMALLFLASDTTFIQAAVVKKDCSLCELESEIQLLNNKVDDLVNQGSTLNTLIQLILNALGIPTPVTPAAMSLGDFEPLFVLGVI